MKLTIGMATYNDFDGVYFTLQSLRMYHNLKDTEVLIVDNKGDDHMRNWIRYWAKDVARYERCTEVTGTSYPRQKVFELAKGEYVICVDSHVMLMPGSLEKLWEGEDLIHGPMCYDDFSYVTYMDSTWRDNMWGIWGTARVSLPEEPFEIPMHGLGLFACRKDSWLGFNPQFKGFGGEEGYIHEKFRQAGKRIICLPWLRWVHKFRNGNIPYPLHIEDRIRNYLIGFNELNLDPTPIYEHFGIQRVKKIQQNINEYDGALNYEQ